MPRPAKVWHRADTGWWMITLNGVKTKLIRGPDDDLHRQLAEEKFHELRGQARNSPHSSNATVRDIIEEYLEWASRHLAADTYRTNRFYAESFAVHCGTVLARDLKPFHVTKWITIMMSPERVAKQLELRAADLDAGAIQKRYQGRPPKVWGPGTAHNGRTVAFRVFSWAKDEGMLAFNPLTGLKRPRPAPRHRAMTEAEFMAMHRKASPEFADFLLALYETGARPIELRRLVWSQVHGDRLIVKNKTGDKTKRPRVIILSETMQAVLNRLKGKGNGHTHVFLNRKGVPWTTNAVRLRVDRLRKSLGLASDLCAYLARHGFGTRAILNGVNPAVVAELMGHTSLEMVSRVYVHIADEHEHLKDAVERINRPIAVLAPTSGGSSVGTASPAPADASLAAAPPMPPEENPETHRGRLA